jgi:hypothetical protein
MREGEQRMEKEQNELKNCLRNERITIRHIPKQTGLVDNPKHVLYGGLGEGATRTFCVPKLKSGVYVNVLTKDEKDYLEHIMGMEYNALSVYNKPANNFWSDANVNGISNIVLGKDDTYLDLSNPNDYIRYKIALANKDFIAPDIETLQERPKATYQFVILRADDETRNAQQQMSNTMMSYKEFGKIEHDKDAMRFVILSITGDELAFNTSEAYLQTKINELIQADPKLFLKVIKDELFSTKLLLRQCVASGLVAKRGDFYYNKADNSPLCKDGENPTLTNAARYLMGPRQQELLFSLQKQVQESKKEQ